MARATNKLSATILKTREPGLHADGGGLFLQVTLGADGAPRRSWLCRVRLPGGDTRELGLGSASEVTLAQARSRCEEARRLGKSGIDPKAAKKQARMKAAAEAARAMTFRQAAEGYIAAHQSTWRNAKHVRQWSATLAHYVYPVFGDVAVAEVDQAMVMRVLDPIWLTKTETASRVRGRIEAVLDWAAVRGHRSGENPARWRGHLQKALPPRSKAKRVEHHAAIPFEEMPAFMAMLGERGGAGAHCLAFLILTASRYSEATGARCREIDLARAVWTIPAERMKAGREHRVPLPPAALAILERRRARHGQDPDGLVFESDMRRGARLSDATLTAVLRRLGRSETVHGLRSSFRDWAAERTNFAREVAEAALAHTIGDKVEAAYRRGDLFEKRRRLMEAWAEYLASPARSDGGEVVALSGNSQNGGRSPLD